MTSYVSDIVSGLFSGEKDTQGDNVSKIHLPIFFNTFRTVPHFFKFADHYTTVIRPKGTGRNQ